MDITLEVSNGAGGWVDVACDATSASWSWGTSEDAGVVTLPNAGSAQLRLNDPDRRMDPDNTGSDLYGLLDVRTPARITLDGWVAYTGYVDTISHDLAVADVALTDPVAALAAVKFVETSRPAETTSARVSAILKLAKWPTTLTDVEGGGVPLQAGTIATDAWSDMADVTRQELGLVWVDREAVVHWRKRATAWADTPPVLTIGCEPSDAIASALELGLDPDTLRNYLSLARRGGTARIYQSTDSQAKYGPYTYVQHDLEHASDGDRDLWGIFYLDRQANPARGPRKVQVHNPSPEFVAKAMEAGFGAVVRYQDDGHYGDPFVYFGRLVGWQWQVSATDQGNDVTVTIGLGRVAAIGPKVRTVRADTAQDFDDMFTYGTACTNVQTDEPGLRLSVIAKRPGQPVVLQRPRPRQRVTRA